MDKKPVGQSGVTITVIGLGTAPFAREIDERHRTGSWTMLSRKG